MAVDIPDTIEAPQRDLVPVNAVIGFLKRGRVWPSVLYELGYKLAMIEQPVSVPAIGEAEVDVICLNHGRNHALLWECKSGYTLKEKQARVYASATAEDVQRTGNVTFPDPGTASVEPVYCCLEADQHKVVATLRDWGVTIPVVSLGGKALLASGKFQDDLATARFSPGITLPPLEEVPWFLPANTQTEKWRLAGPVLATVVSLLRKQCGRFTVRRVLEDSFPDWECMGTDLRRYLQSKAKEILEELCDSELKELARRVRATHSPGELLVEFTVDVLGQDASMRTRTFQRLARLASSYVERTREKQPYEPSREPRSLWLPGMEPE